MVSRLPVIDEDGEVGDLSQVDPSLFRPFSELPLDMQKMLSSRHGKRGKQKAPLKVPTTLRLDADILEAFKAQGRGWQTRMNDALRAYLGKS
jgi:uncharacterized protein (DUF4415 family)